MQNGKMPLEGIRVLELAQIVAGPFCGALMAEFGAEVIKVEMPGRGDDIRRMGPREGEVGFWWAQENRGKKALTLDLHDPQGQWEREPNACLAVDPRPGCSPRHRGDLATSPGPTL